MRNLLFTLFIATILISCESSSTGPEPFEPYQIGAWTIQSEDNANWVGRSGQRKSSTDTLVYLSPDNNSITITEIGDKRADIVYTDSSYAGQEVDVLWAPLQSINILGWGTNIYDTHIRVALQVDFVCSYESYAGDPDLGFSYVQDSTETVFKFEVDGLEETMFEILCVN